MLQVIENKIIEYLKTYNPHKIAVFGSYVRNQQTTNSDIDLLVDFKKTPTLLTLIKIENDLSSILGIKVDLLTEGALKNRIIKENIEKDLQVIYHD